MIVRWYMALSEFSYTLEFIPGVDNNIADAMSRLCRIICYVDEAARSSAMRQEESQFGVLDMSL